MPGSSNGGCMIQYEVFTISLNLPSIDPESQTVQSANESISAGNACISRFTPCGICAVHVTPTTPRRSICDPGSTGRTKSSFMMMHGRQLTELGPHTIQTSRFLDPFLVSLLLCVATNWSRLSARVFHIIIRGKGMLISGATRPGIPYGGTTNRSSISFEFLTLDCKRPNVNIVDKESILFHRQVHTLERHPDRPHETSRYDGTADWPC